MRKIVSCSLIMIMCFAFSACSDTGSEQKQDASSSSDGYEFHGLSEEIKEVNKEFKKYVEYVSGGGNMEVIKLNDNSSDESEQ